ncbi:MAG: T9SS type A sorting domain-containing protein [Ignavibacteria bacterium]|nr:T9SS type A sorting domain-containing protein [Ignavibacteria bacterium]
MKTKQILIILISFLIYAEIFSQVDLNKIEKRLPHSLNPFQENINLQYQQSSVDTFHLLAVMVDFAVDQDAATYGNGKFGSHYSKDYGKFIIDPLPHDRNYFKAHLEFLRNYYLNVSDKRVVIEYEVLDKIVTLPNVMSYYSPPPKSNDLSRLGILFEAVWKKVDSLYPNQDFTKYDVFTIFHAGVGRDIVIPETFGLEKDIPSVYLSPATLKNFFGSNYQGVKIGNPPKYVLNSMILPETESREIETLTGKALLELSINGLLAASFGSFLGLPDLFDTKTGKTAIGRFGLMDGQSMFAYAGLFPPEPSAWEKYFLGWVTPKEISKDTLNLEIYSRISSPKLATHVYKIPINPREYYLIENRQKDRRGDGIKIKSKIGINLVEFNFQSDWRRFSSYYVDTVDGVVIDVDEFDWATPGNGILIWHIDEKVISENFASNSINANPKMKGIRLIEADGIQDIGNEFKTIFGDVIVGEGDSVDFWFKGNPSKFYRNEFSDETRPRTLSNNGSPTYIKIYDFSNSDGRMTFSVSFGNDEIKNIFTEKISPSLKTEFIHCDRIDTSKIFLKSNNKFFFYDLRTKTTNQLADFTLSNVLAFQFSQKTIYAYVQDFLRDINKELFLTYVYGDSIITKYYSIPSVEDVKYIFAYKKFSNFSDENNYAIRILTKTGQQFEFHFSDKSFHSTGLNINEETITTSFDGSKEILLTKNNVYFGTKRVAHTIVNPSELILIWDNSLAQTPDKKILAAVFDKDGFVEILNETGTVSKFKFETNDTNFSVAAGNLRNDETNYLIVRTSNKIFAFNKAGSIADNYPIEAPFGTKFTGSISLVDYNKDGKNDILVMTEDGRLICYDGNTPKKTLINFSIGYPSSGSHFLYNQNKLFLLSGNDSGYVQLIQISREEKIIKWTMNSSNLFGDKISEIPAGAFYRDEFLPKERVYNWPNPVYDDRTYFRVYVSEDANVKIKIYDLSGAFVDEINGFAFAGIDNEFVWNVKNIQSGVYLAKVEATSTSKSDFKIVKVAVVK